MGAWASSRKERLEACRTYFGMVILLLGAATAIVTLLWSCFDMPAQAVPNRAFGVILAGMLMKYGSTLATSSRHAN